MPEQSSLDLGVIGNAAIAALLDGEGGIVWFCVPRLDGDPVFCRLLSGDKPFGEWRIVVPHLVHAEQSYRRNTAILETILTDADGSSVRIVDFAPRFRSQSRVFRPVTLIRVAEPLVGRPRITVRVSPRHGYGAYAATTTRGSNHLRFSLGERALRLTTNMPIAYLESGTPFVLDRPVAFSLGPDEPLSEAPLEMARQFLDQTEAYWIDWTRALSVPLEWQEVVIRAAITLKLCSFEETGGIVAALTTSVPEYGGGGRNWDYRYCWLRDAFFTVRALNRLGATRTMEGYLRYVTNIVGNSADGYLQPLYGLGLESSLAEATAPSLEGYRSLGPVRRGNAAYSQRQNDGYGSLILAIAQSFYDARLPAMGDTALYRRLEPLGQQALRRWSEPDAGLWEYRSRSAVHTHSAMMCWAAADRLARIAARLGLADRFGFWRTAADQMREAILVQAWNPTRGHFVSRFGGEDIDASLLLMPEVGFLAASDARFAATLAVVEKTLRAGHHLYRYRIPDDFGEAASAFSACTFWLIDALARVGRLAEARESFSEMLMHRNRLGLLSEGIRVETGELWGNFPQTYSMVGLINAAIRLSPPWEEAF
ncbi:MAG: glycoside hydrolase family 15 protein [Bauldia sp.]